MNSDINPTGPPPEESNIYEALKSSSTGDDFKTFHASGNDGGMGGFKAFFGEEGFKKFTENCCSYISDQMKRDEKEMEKANRRLKAIEEGQDPSDVE